MDPSRSIDVRLVAGWPGDSAYFQKTADYFVILEWIAAAVLIFVFHERMQ